MKPQPYFWALWLCRMFQTTEGFAGQLWDRYTPPPVVLWQLRLCSEATSTPEALVTRVERLGKLVPPAALIGLSVQLAPEGTRRRRDAVEFEAMVLHYTDKHGH